MNRLVLAVVGIPAVTVPLIKANQYYCRNFKYPQNTIHSEWFENNGERKNVIVIGSGVNGLCNAYQLSKFSKNNEYINKIAIIDKSGEMADECTKAAAGGMARQYSKLDKTLLKSIIGNFTTNRLSSLKSLFVKNESNADHGTRDSKHFDFFRIQWKNVLFSLHFYQWGLSFLYNAFLSNNHKNEDVDMPPMDTLIAESTQYLIDFVSNNSDNIKVVGGNEKDSGKSLSDSVGFNKNGGIFLYRDSKKVQSVISNLGLSDENNSIIMNDKNFDEKTIHLFDKVHNEKGLMKIYYGYQDGEPIQFIDLSNENIGSEMKIEVLKQIDASLGQTVNVNEIKGIYNSFQAAMADCHTFSVVLGKYLTNEINSNVDFWGNTEILDIEYKKCVKNNNNNNNYCVSKLYTNRGIINIPENTLVIVSAGAWTPLILRKIGVFIPVYPLKGYDIVLDYQFEDEKTTENEKINKFAPLNMPNDIVKLPKHLVPQTCIIEGHLYVTIMGTNRLRIASLGEFDGWNTQPNSKTENDFRKEAARLYPFLGKYILDKNVTPMICGLRPLTSDASVIINKVDKSLTHFNIFNKKCFDNLYVNVGPGQNGWKAAMGQGRILANKIANDIDTTNNSQAKHVSNQENQLWVKRLQNVSK